MIWCESSRPGHLPLLPVFAICWKPQSGLSSNNFNQNHGNSLRKKQPNILIYCWYTGTRMQKVDLQQYGTPITYITFDLWMLCRVLRIFCHPFASAHKACLVGGRVLALPVSSDTNVTFWDADIWKGKGELEFGIEIWRIWMKLKDLSKDP